MKGAVDEFMGRFESYLDLTGVGIGDEGLMLGECGWSEYGSEGEDCEGFNFTSPMVFYLLIVVLSVVRFKPATVFEQWRRRGSRESALR